MNIINRFLFHYKHYKQIYSTMNLNLIHQLFKSITNCNKKKKLFTLIIRYICLKSITGTPINLRANYYVNRRMCKSAKTDSRTIKDISV